MRKAGVERLIAATTGFPFGPQCGTEADTAADRFFTVYANSRRTNALKIEKEFMPIRDCELSPRVQAVDLQQTISVRTFPGRL